MRPSAPSASLFPTLWTKTRTNQCVAVGGWASAPCVLVFLAALLISDGSAESANATVFYIIAIFLFLSCALSSLVATQKRNKFGAAGFAVTAAILIIVSFAFMVSDAADAACEGNAIYIWSCAPGEKQHPLALAVQDCIILATFAVFAVAGGKRFAHLHAEGELYMRGGRGDGGAMSDSSMRAVDDDGEGFDD
jgi:hypothetical protein